MSAISIFADKSISQLFGVAEAAIFNETNPYIRIPALQGISIRDLNAKVKAELDAHNATDATKRSGLSSKYGLEKIATFYASLREYSRVLDTQRQAPPAPEFSVLSLPFKVQHRLMNEVTCILEASCFQFVKGPYQEKLTERGWDCAERAELNRFDDLLAKAKSEGRLHWYGPVPGRINDRSSARKGVKKPQKDSEFEQYWRPIEEIRHTSVHRNHPSAARTIELLRAAEDLLGALNDVSAREKISKLLQQTESIRDEMETQRANFKEAATKALKNLEDQRLDIVGKQVEEIERMLEQDREICHDPRTASSLDDMLRSLQVSDIPSDNHVQDDTVERGADTAIQGQGEQNSKAIFMQDAESPEISMVQPYEGGRDDPTVNGTHCFFDRNIPSTDSTLLTVSFKGETNIERSPGVVPNHSSLPDDTAEVPIHTPSAQPDLVRAISEDPRTIGLTHETVAEPMVPSPTAAPTPALGSHEASRVEILATGELQSAERDGNENGEAYAALDEEEAVMPPADSHTMPSSSAD